MVDLKTDDLRLIDYVLSYYIDKETEELSKLNCGDMEWDKLNKYKQLRDTIKDSLTMNSSQLYIDETC